MSATSPLPAKVPISEIVDLTEDMSDLGEDEQSGAEESDGSGETENALKPRKKRRARRGIKARVGKEAAKLNKLQDDKTTRTDQGMFRALDWKVAHYGSQCIVCCLHQDRDPTDLSCVYRILAV
jgi:hypothetical protein